VARPFLKWAGGKGRLAPRIVELAPAMFGRYHEPFVGAGAVFFALEEARSLVRPALSDANADLIACYSVVRDAPRELADRLADLEANYIAGDRKAFYYEQRATQPYHPIDRAARFIFLNRTCYNGLYRVNASGGFNVPHGRYSRPRIADPDGLRAAARAMAGAELCPRDFAEACHNAQRGDFVYLDPPYQPLSATSRFTSYTSADFGPIQQEQLRDTFDDLTRRGVHGFLSNSDHPFIRALYEGRGYSLEIVEMSRAINSRASARAPIGELLISNISAVR
jgi:DNA adenine methylase